MTPFVQQKYFRTLVRATPGGEFRFRQSVIDIFLERHTVRAMSAPTTAAA